MTLEDRQEQILDAVLPAVLEHGATITSRQLAEAAGVAEGTLFRSFGDKDSLLRSVFDRAADIAYELDDLDEAEAQDLATTVQLLTGVLIARFTSIFQLAIALGPVLFVSGKHDDPRFDELRTHIAELLARHRDELKVEPRVAADALRSLALAASTGWCSSVAMHMSDVTGILLHGIAHTPNHHIEKYQEGSRE